MKIKKQELMNEAEKKLKKIWDSLRDKCALRFELSVKVDFFFLRKPETYLKKYSKKYFLQGERSADGGWNISVPTGQNSSAPQLHNTLEAKLTRIKDQVHKYIVENSLDADWKKMEASIEEALKSGLSDEDLEYRSAVPIQAFFATSYDAHFCAPVMATAYATWCAEALAKNNLEHASYYAYRGLYWSSPTMFIPNPNGRFTARAGTGGHGKHLLRKPVKDKVAELLVSMAPATGWESISTATEAVANELIFRHSGFVENGLLKPEALPRTIRGWVKTDPERFKCSIKSKT